MADGGGASTNPAHLVIDYATLRNLAKKLGDLHDKVQSQVTAKLGSGEVYGADGKLGPAELGRTDVDDALKDFYNACSGPFKDSTEKLKSLSDMFDHMATRYADIDANLATRENAAILKMQYADWLGQKSAYDQFLNQQKLVVTGQLFDKDGKVINVAEPFGAGATPPPKPADQAPTSYDTVDPVTHQVLVHTEGSFTDKGNIASETSTANLPDGKPYTETTTNVYTPGPDAGKETVTSSTQNVTGSDGTTSSAVTTTLSNGGTHVETTFADGSKSTSDSAPPAATTSANAATPYGHFTYPLSLDPAASAHFGENVPWAGSGYVETKTTGADGSLTDRFVETWPKDDVWSVTSDNKGHIVVTHTTGGKTDVVWDSRNESTVTSTTEITGGITVGTL
jgi:hypothetical protein